MVTLWIVSALLVVAAIDLNAVLGAIIAGTFLLANTLLTLIVTSRRDRHDRDMIREEVELAEQQREAKRKRRKNTQTGVEGTADLDSRADRHRPRSS